MANPPMGNNIIEGPLGVVDLIFDDVELGYTDGEAELRFIEDVKDIKYAQTGTQPFDKVPTGQAYEVTCKLAQPTWARLKKILRGVNASSDGNSVKLGRDIYRSGIASFAKELKVRRVDSDGVASTNPRFIITFWKAFPAATGALGAWGADTQRTVDVSFFCMYDTTPGHDGYGFSGAASSVGVY